MGAIIKILLALSPALEKGQTLKYADTWYNVVTAKVALVTVLGFLLMIAKSFSYDLPISDTQIADLSGALASVGGSIVLYFSVATNPNRGITKR